jgi:acetyltransferase-like isoleucine patch superfamily enzyme
MIKIRSKAIQEVGLKKTIRFLLYCFVEVFYHNIIDHALYFSHARKLFLSLLGAKIGKNTILMNVRFFNWHHTGPGGLHIGKECFLGDETLIDLYNEVVLEDQVTLAQKVTVLTHLNVGYKNHPLQKFFPKTAKKVTFKKGCVVAANCTILPGITIGEKSFVAAGSVVTKNVPSQTLVAGVPAKKIRKIS